MRISYVVIMLIIKLVCSSVPRVLWSEYENEHYYYEDNIMIVIYTTIHIKSTLPTILVDNLISTVMPGFARGYRWFDVVLFYHKMTEEIVHFAKRLRFSIPLTFPILISNHISGELSNFKTAAGILHFNKIIKYLFFNLTYTCL